MPLPEKAEPGIKKKKEKEEKNMNSTKWKINLEGKEKTI